MNYTYKSNNKKTTEACDLTTINIAKLLKITKSRYNWKSYPMTFYKNMYPLNSQTQNLTLGSKQYLCSDDCLWDKKDYWLLKAFYAVSYNHTMCTWYT